MLSPAKASFQRKLAMMAQGAAHALASAGKAPPMPTEGAVASEYQLLLAALGIDLNALRNIESTDRKIEAKREMFGKYRAWLTGTLEGGSGSGIGAQDEIVANMLVWSIDLAEWDTALALADYMLRHGLALPERFDRKPATLIAEEVAEAGLAKTPGIGLDMLQAFARLVADADIHNQVRAKLEKALGLAFKTRADTFEPDAETAVAGGKGALIDVALAHFHEAMRLNPACGVKKLIEALTRERAKLAAPHEGN